MFTIMPIFATLPHIIFMIILINYSCLHIFPYTRVHVTKSPLALYRAFRAANVHDDIARDAAYAVSADLKAMIGQFVIEQNLDVANARIGLAGKSRSADA